MNDPEFPVWAEMTDGRREHVRRVAGLLSEWADDARIPEEERRRWLVAAYLHDAVKDAAPDWLRSHSDDTWGMDALHHGPAAATLAARHGETDAGILDAVRYHSIGYAGWDRVGEMLYLADFLEPGRPMVEPWIPEVRDRVPDDPRSALRHIATLRVGFLVKAGWPLFDETVAFWNHLWSDE
jgi:HD superfamily phosphohydrolase YqeK